MALFVYFVAFSTHTKLLLSQFRRLLSPGAYMNADEKKVRKATVNGKIVSVSEVMQGDRQLEI